MVRKAFRGLLEKASNGRVRANPICQAKFPSSEITQTNEGGFMFCGGSFVILIRFRVAAKQVNQSIGSIVISDAQAFCGLNGNLPAPFVIRDTAGEPGNTQQAKYGGECYYDVALHW